MWQDYNDDGDDGGDNVEYDSNQTGSQCVDGEYGVVDGECDSYTTCSNGVLYTKLCSPGG